MVISISGPAGSGTTTVAKILAEKYGLKHIYAGQMMRDLAKQRGMDVYEFNDYVVQHPEIDEEVDNTIVREADKGDKIVEGRLSGWMMTRNRIPAFKIYFTIDPEVAAKRVAARDGITAEEALKYNFEREHEHWERFRKLYKVDRDDTSIYDCVIDTSHHSVEDVVRSIEHELAEYQS